MLAQNHQKQPSVAQAPMRSRSGTSGSIKSKARPISRGSTTSEHSVGPTAGNQHHPEHIMEHQSGSYMAHIDPSEQRMYQQGPEEVLLQYGQQIAQTQQYSIDPNLPEGHHNGMRPASPHGYAEQSLHQFHIMQGYPQGMPQYGISQETIHANSRHPEGMENQSPAPDDSENAEPGAKKKKGAATSMANDAELRRLLQQYKGRTLKEVATEVQKKEGGEGKSEKAKQVFAMLWLEENCRRSSHSVRRDRVFSRYTERCGNERVPTLNPASFGKLVRIIFPNVQTRRLGVRGESKYHYVDLSLFPEDEDRQHQQYQQYQMMTIGGGDAIRDMHKSVPVAAGVQQSHPPSTNMPQSVLPQPPTDSADFPLPSKTYAPRPTDSDEIAQLKIEPAFTSANPSAKMDCHYLNTPTIRLRTSNMQIPLVSALPAVRSSLPGTISSYLGLPSSTTHSTFSPPNAQADSPIDLPDIHGYLANTTYDSDIATSLSHLYRSYCIIVIDSFRYCREKPFFHHHSAFNGTMTVPISKMLANERLAPWVQECDMRMYKKMIRYIAPLVTQVVPEQVWTMFDHVSQRLVPHLVSAFEEKCPTHVLVAKIIPAARFCHLLKKLKAANIAANHAATMLADERGRSQMWIDLLYCVDPERVIEESMPPPECWSAAEGILSRDIKKLIAPTEEDFVRAAEQDLSSTFAGFIAATEGADGLTGSTTENEEVALSPLDGWIQWLERLPVAFPKHHPQCLINWHNGFWKSVMTQLGIGGASTYQAWWYLEAFLNNMLGWLTQMEGLLMEDTQQKDLEEREILKKRQDEYLEVVERSLQMDGTNGGQGKRKRSDDDAGVEERSASRASHTSQSSNDREADSRPQTGMTSNTGLDGAVEDHELDELGNGAPLDLPSIDISPQKRQHQAHDDSGISLDVDIEGEVSGGEDQLKKLKKEWGILSDPADADGHVVVV